MTSMAFEAVLAKLYVDAEYRARFLADPYGTAHEAGLSPTECEALAAIDQTGLKMAAASYARKRENRKSRAASI